MKYKLLTFVNTTKKQKTHTMHTPCNKNDYKFCPTAWSLYLRANAGLEYSIINTYIVTIECEDDHNGVGSATFTLDVEENVAPAFQNVPGEWF